MALFYILDLTRIVYLTFAMAASWELGSLFWYPCSQTLQLKPETSNTATNVTIRVCVGGSEARTCVF